MKKSSNNYFSQMSRSQLSSLMSIVDETLAAEAMASKKRTFTSVDLWNVQRNRRSFTQRRYSL